MSHDSEWLHKLRKGDSVYCVPDSRFNPPYLAKVVGQGPKYVTCARKYGGAIQAATFRIQKSRWAGEESAQISQEYGTGDAVYPSEERYQQIQRAKRLYNAVQDRFNYGRVDDALVEQIAVLLGIEL